MTDLMEALFEYINKVTLQNYLAVDSDYRISSTPVSYTHLDVYKRQLWVSAFSSSSGL